MDKEQKELCNKIFYLLKKGFTFNQICNDLEMKENEVFTLIMLMIQNGYNVDIINGEPVIFKQPVRHKDIYEVPYNLEHLKLLLISDTHLCSKYDRLDILNYLYSKADEQGVKHILHSGDFTDGRSNRPEQIYELREPSFEGQVEYCVKKYPKFNGKTYAIQGNHDD